MRDKRNRTGERRTYFSWRDMMRRCYDKSSVGFPYYGDRGITVYKEWHIYANFLSDMGSIPKGKTLDRKNTNDNYYKENCKWSTMSEQNRNRNFNIKIEFNGLTLTLAEWARLLLISNSNAFYYRVHKWGFVRAATTPFKFRYKK